MAVDSIVHIGIFYFSTKNFLYEIFSSFGVVVDVYAMRDQSRQSHGS